MSTPSVSAPPALLAPGTVVRMKAGYAVEGKVVACWPVHPGSARMVAAHGEWARAALAYPVAKVAWGDEEVTHERVRDLVVVREDIVTLYERIEALKASDPRYRGNADEVAALYLDLEVVVRDAGWTFMEYLAALASV